MPRALSWLAGWSQIGNPGYNGEPFANNQIPQSRIHPGALNVLNQYVPLPKEPQVDPLAFTDRAGIVQPIDDDFIFGRVDHYFSEGDRIFGRIAWDSAERLVANINPNSNERHLSDVQNLATSWIHTFTPTMINDVRFGFNRSGSNRFNPFTNDDSFDMDGLGIGLFRIPGDNNRPLDPLEHGIPNISARFALGSGGEFNQLDSYQTGNHLSWMRGSHNLKMGGEWYYNTIDRAAANLPTGTLSFGGNESGDAFASYLLGLPSQTNTPEGLIVLQFPPAAANESTVVSLGRALVIAGARMLEVDSRELDTRPKPSQGGGASDLLVFDSGSSGAGHCRELFDNGEEWFSEARNVPEGDPSHDKRCESACLDCILDFSGQFSASKLDRRAALKLLD